MVSSDPLSTPAVREFLEGVEFVKIPRPPLEFPVAPDELDEALAEELEAAGPPRTTTDVIRDGRAILTRHEELHEAVRVIGHHLNTLPPLERAALRRYMARVYFPTL